MSAGQTSQWKWALKLTNKCFRNFHALKTQVQLRDMSACGNGVSDSHQGASQVTLKAGTSCSHEQH